MKTKEFISILFLEVCIIFLISFSIIFANNQMLNLALLIQFIGIFAYLLKNITLNFINIIYLTFFYAFLAQIPIYNIFKEDIYKFGENANFKATMLVLISVMSIFFGIIVEKIIKSEDVIENLESKISGNTVSRVAFALIIFTAPFAIYNTITNVSTVSEFGYVSLYTNANVSWIDRFANFNIAFIYIYLSTLPNKKMFKRSLFIIFPLMIMDIFTGRRGNAIINVIVIITYILLRKTIYKNEKFKINIKTIIPVIIIGIVIAYVSTYISQVRLNESVDVNEAISALFNETSKSFNFIESAYYFENNIKNADNAYSLQALFNGSQFFAGIQNLFDFLRIEGGNFNHNLGSIVAYVREPTYYKAGGGFGTSYIIELYMDLGYFAVIPYNVLLGYFLTYINHHKFFNWVKFSMILMVLRTIYFMPRESTFNWINQIFSVTNLLAILLVWLIDNIYRKRERSK